MIKVLIVNDSIPIQQILKRIIASDPELEVVGVADNGLQAIQLTKSNLPDVVLMDICMPICDGVEATREIMTRYPCAILIVTATILAHMPHIYQCLNFGAMEVVRTPVLKEMGRGKDEPEFFREIGSELLKRIKVLSKLKKRVRGSTPAKFELKRGELFKPRPEALVKGAKADKIVAIGASTGGPSAILHVLQGLPDELSAALILVQHIDASFAVGLAEWFDSNLNGRLNIYAAKEGDTLVKGTGFLACADKDMTISKGYSLEYKQSEPKAFFCPSIDVTFESVARLYGKNAIGVLLTGMGDDGARGLKAIRSAGGTTIAQDEKSSLIYGMPKAAKDTGAAQFILPLKDIAYKIAAVLKEQSPV